MLSNSFSSMYLKVLSRVYGVTYHSLQSGQTSHFILESVIGWNRSRYTQTSTFQQMNIVFMMEKSLLRLTSIKGIGDSVVKDILMARGAMALRAWMIS